MFNKNKFAIILKKINNTYDSQRDFAKKSNINRTYLSQYMNLKLEKPPKPEILNKLSQASNGIISYEDLMQVCGYNLLTHLSKDTYSDFIEITDDEWSLLFGSSKNINLNNNEAVAWANLVENLSNPRDSQKINFIEDNYTKFATNKDEFIMIRRLFHFFLLILCKFIGKKDAYDDLISDIKEMNLKMNNSTSFFNVPIIGKITAGQPILAQENIEGYLPVDPNVYGLTTSSDLFYLRVSGESMNLKIHNGDYALIHKQDYAENGDIIVAIINSDDEATLKRYKKINDEIIMLEPMSSYPMEPIVINLKETKFLIIGKAIGQFGKF